MSFILNVTVIHTGWWFKSNRLSSYCRVACVNLETSLYRTSSGIFRLFQKKENRHKAVAQDKLTDLVAALDLFVRIWKVKWRRRRIFVTAPVVKNGRTNVAINTG